MIYEKDGKKAPVAGGLRTPKEADRKLIGQVFALGPDLGKPKPVSEWRKAKGAMRRYGNGKLARQAREREGEK